MKNVVVSVERIEEMIESVKADMEQTSYMKAFPEMEHWNKGYIAALETLRNIYS